MGLINFREIRSEDGTIWKKWKEGRWWSGGGEEKRRRNEEEMKMV